jgi:hypothetical protein
MASLSCQVSSVSASVTPAAGRCSFRNRSWQECTLDPIAHGKSHTCAKIWQFRPRDWAIGPTGPYSGATFSSSALTVTFPLEMCIFFSQGE